MGYFTYRFARTKKLYRAVRDGDDAAFDALLAHGADVCRTESGGFKGGSSTLLHTAVAAGNGVAVRKLLRHPAFSDWMDREPHHICGVLEDRIGRRDNAMTLAVLQDCGTKALSTVLRQKKYYGTLLHYAAQHGMSESVIAAMADKGAEPSVRLHGLTAREIAQANGHEATAEALARAEAKARQLRALFAPADVPPPAPVPSESLTQWTKLGDDRIARIHDDVAIGYRLTDIFNFDTREVKSLSRNLDTGAEAHETRGFDDIADKTAIEAALSVLQDMGGRVAADCLHRLRKPRAGG